MFRVSPSNMASLLIVGSGKKEIWLWEGSKDHVQRVAMDWCSSRYKLGRRKYQS
jgi:hypothetical protein